MTSLRNNVSLLVFAALAAPTLAQSTVDATKKFSYSENCGWMNWRDAGSPQASQGVRIDSSGRFFAGFIWAENVGYINLGDGTPVNGLSYANTNGADFGVNLDGNTGALTGMAWAENVGWINFAGGALATPAQPARFDASTGRLRGFAWGENIGWINLDVIEAGKFVSILPPGGCDAIDFNGDGLFPDDLDLIDFLNVLAGGTCSTGTCNDIDFNNDFLFPDDQDLIDFLSVLAGGECL